MSNAHAVKPELPSPFPDVPPTWKCPKTGLIVPKVPEKNLIWRAELLKRAADDEGLQADLLAACSESALFYINTFVFTYRQFIILPDGRKMPAEQPHVPFVTWPIQDVVTTNIEYAIDNGEDMAADKSRDMGASWIFLAVIDKYWEFRAESQILLLSRTENYVDQTGNRKCLFWKLDYIHQWLPLWMCPPNCLPGEKNRTKMHVENENNGSVIDGESTTPHAARGDRRFLVFMDEFGAVEHGAAMRSATADVTATRLINSTPKAGSAYSTWITGGQIKVTKLPWWEHPEKGIGRYTTQDETTQKWTIRSPWYDSELERRSPREMAQEVDMDHLGSGAVFFESHIVEQHIALFARAPKLQVNIDFDKSVTQDAIKSLIQKRDHTKVKVKRNAKGSWKIWVELVHGRLDQTFNYVVGEDISKGQGASNSTACVYCQETGEKVAEFADANTPPYDFARLMAAAMIWIGGCNPRRLPLQIWEANGPGWDFGRIMVKEYHYPHYYMDESSGKVDVKVTKKYGWQSSRSKKEELLGNYRRLLAHDGIINHSEMALRELLVYIYFESGALGPSFLTEESSEARLTHGDRAMGDALATWVLKKRPGRKHINPVAPYRSAAYRKQQCMRRKKAIADQHRKWRQQFNLEGTHAN